MLEGGENLHLMPCNYSAGPMAFSGPGHRKKDKLVRQGSSSYTRTIVKATKRATGMRTASPFEGGQRNAEGRGLRYPDERWYSRLLASRLSSTALNMVPQQAPHSNHRVWHLRALNIWLFSVFIKVQKSLQTIQKYMCNGKTSLSLLETSERSKL